MQYCIYLRKSRKDMDLGSGITEEETLERHEKTLLGLARKYQFNVTQIYREVVSGETIAARPVMQHLLSEVERGLWQGVLVMEIERLARGDTMDQGFVSQAFKYSNTKIITPMKTYDPNNEFDEEYFEFGLFMSRREYKVINRRLQRGRLASVKEGKYVANQPPYGYIRKKIENDKGYTLEPHPNQADVIKIIFDLYTEGLVNEDGSRNRLGVSLIAKRLNSLKIKPQRSEYWTSSSIRDILINPVYIGKIRWNWRPNVKQMTDGQVEVSRPRANVEDCIIVTGLHEAIVDEDTFNSAQEYMSKNPSSPVPKGSSVKNPLAGVVKCAKCGRSMVRRPFNNGQADILMCSATSCNNVSSALFYVENRILQAMEEWLKEYKLKWDVNETAPKTNSLMEMKQKLFVKLEKEITTLEKQRDNLHDLLEQGIYDTQTFLKRSQDIGQRINQTNNEIKNIKEELKLEEMREESRHSIIPKVENLLEVYNQLQSPKAKNDLLKEVLEKVEYLKEKNGRWHNSPDDFEITLYPKLPKI